MNLKEEISTRIYKYTYQKKFSNKTSELMFSYIDLMYACATPSVSLSMALGLLYANMGEAKQYHKIERTKIDNILRVFSGQLNEYYDEYYNKKVKYNKLSFNEINSAMNIILASYVPSVVEPIYKMEETK